MPYLGVQISQLRDGSLFPASSSSPLLIHPPFRPYPSSWRLQSTSSSHTFLLAGLSSTSSIYSVTILLAIAVPCLKFCRVLMLLIPTLCAQPPWPPLCSANLLSSSRHRPVVYAVIVLVCKKQTPPFPPLICHGWFPLIILVSASSYFFRQSSISHVLFCFL